MATIAVPSNTPLDRVHQMIQAAMGWHDTHLCAFENDTYTIIDPRSGAAGISADGERLVSIATEPGQRFSYRYDFGDNWWHTVTVEEVRAAGPEGPSPPAKNAISNVVAPGATIPSGPGRAVSTSTQPDPRRTRTGTTDCSKTKMPFGLAKTCCRSVRRAVASAAARASASPRCRPSAVARRSLSWSGRRPADLISLCGGGYRPGPRAAGSL